MNLLTAYGSNYLFPSHEVIRVFFHANCNSMTTADPITKWKRDRKWTTTWGNPDKLPSILYISVRFLDLTEVDTMSLVQLFNRTGFSFMFFVTEQAFWAAFIPPPDHELMLLCTVLVVPWPSIGVFSAVLSCWWELLAGCGLISNECPKGTWGNTRCRCFSTLRIEDTLKADFH